MNEIKRQKKILQEMLRSKRDKGIKCDRYIDDEGLYLEVFDDIVGEHPYV